MRPLTTTALALAAIAAAAQAQPQNHGGWGGRGRGQHPPPAPAAQGGWRGPAHAPSPAPLAPPASHGFAGGQPWHGQSAPSAPTRQPFRRPGGADWNGQHGGWAQRGGHPGWNGQAAQGHPGWNGQAVPGRQVWRGRQQWNGQPHWNGQQHRAGPPAPPANAHVPGGQQDWHGRGAMPGSQGGSGHWRGQGGEHGGFVGAPGEHHQLRDRDRGRRWFDPDRYPHEFRAERRFYVRPYDYPQGWYARSWYFGDYLPWGWFAPNYYLDWGNYGLPSPPIGAEWIREGHDALLIDIYTGEVLSVEYNVFWW